MSLSGFHSSAQASHSFDLSGLVVLVTGGGSGVGKMIALGLARAGAEVYIGGRREAPLWEVKRVHEQNDNTKGLIHPLVMDVTDKASIRNAVEVINQNHSKLDLLVNNVGAPGPHTPFSSSTAFSAPERKDTATFGRALFQSQSHEEWATLSGLNVASAFFCTCASLGLLVNSISGKGREGNKSSERTTALVLNVTSGVSVMKLAYGFYAYTATKNALSHLTRVLASDFALKDIPVRVNAICPGMFPTQLSAERQELAGMFSGFMMHDEPIGRPGRDEEMAAAVVYLASREAEFMNGHEFLIDGGLSLVNP